MKALFIINGLGFSDNTGIGGADKRAVEVARVLNQDGHSFDILTTSSGKTIFQNDEKLVTNYLTVAQPKWWSKSLNKLMASRVLSYFYVTIASFAFISKTKDYDIFLPSSDFFVDLLPAYLFKLINKKNMVCIMHHFIKSPAKRTGSLSANILLFLSQQFSIFCIRHAADALFLYETPEGHELYSRFFLKTHVPCFYIKNGIDTKKIDSVSPQAQVYTAAFVGGIRPSKGIMDLPVIWQVVQKSFPQAKLVIIGGGDAKTTNELKTKVGETNMTDYIELTGPLPANKVLEKLKSSRIFLFPSYEEGWGIAVLEAMYTGLPVVCYGLPAFRIFGNVLTKVSTGDKQTMAAKTVELLSDPVKLKELAVKSKETAKDFTWEKVAHEDLSYYLKLTA